MNYAIFGNDPRFDYLSALLDNAGFTYGTPCDILILSHKENINAHKGCLAPDGHVFGGRDFAYSHQYKVKNSMLTAEGALALATVNTDFSINDSEVLVLGYGYLGKAVSKLFSCAGAKISVASRQDSELFDAISKGYKCLGLNALSNLSYDIIINTIPAKILENSYILPSADKGILLELASISCTDDTFTAMKVVRGSSLPGKCCPKTAALLIFDEIMKMLQNPEK